MDNYKNLSEQAIGGLSLMPKLLIPQHTIIEAVTTKEEAETLFKLLQNVWDKLELDSFAYAIAAPQVALAQQVFLCRLPESPELIQQKKEEGAWVDAHGRLLIVNPTMTILDETKHIYRHEGCLSFPGQSINTSRYRSVRLRWYYPGREDAVYTMEPEPFIDNVVIQHEIEHLSGRTFFDSRISEHEANPKRRAVGRNDTCVCGSGKKYKKCCYA